MTEVSMPPASRGFARWALVCLALASSWPYLSLLNFGPMTTDDAVWVANGSVGRPGWLAWVFQSGHLAGYRPVAALSFSLESWISGFHPWSYRLTNIGLHLAVGLLVPLLYRRLAPELPRWGAAVACGLYLLHPLAEFGVPYLARRSYLLGALFSVAALCVLLGPQGGRASPTVSWPCRIGAGVLLALAMLSNETSFVTAGVAVVLPFLLPAGADRGRGRIASGLRAMVMPAGIAAAIFALRYGVLGGLGGYANPSEVRGGQLTAATYAELYAGSWWSSVLGVPAIVVGAVIVGCYAYRIAQAWRQKDPDWRPETVLVLWLLGFAVLSLTSGTWFHRQLYPALVPFCLLAAVVLAATWRGYTLRTGRARWPTLALFALQCLVLVGVVAASPSVRGPDPARMREWSGRSRLLAGLEAGLSTVEEPATVLLVLPASISRGAEPPRKWALQFWKVWPPMLVRDRDVAIQGLLYYERADSAGEPSLRVEASNSILIVPAGLAYHVGDQRLVADRDLTLDLSQVEVAPGRAVYAYVSGAATSQFVRIR